MSDLTKRWFFLFGIEQLKGRALFEPVSDNCLRQVNSILPFPRPAAANRNVVLHVATEVYETGGHTRLLEDIAAALPEMRQTLVITDITYKCTSFEAMGPLLQQRFAALGVEVLFLRPNSLVGKIQELMGIVERLAPQAIFLAAHYYDTIAYTAIAGNSAPHVNFLHHIDHLPSLGATRADYSHVDITPNCHQFCRMVPELKVSMLNMTIADRGVASIDWTTPLTAATCGAAIKYSGDSDYTYPELLAALFAAGLEKLHHIGTMEEAQQQSIRDHLIQAGHDAGRILFHPNTPSLAEKLRELAPHFYLASHPTGGAKANIEAMSVGLPVMQTRPVGVVPLFQSDMTLGAGAIIQLITDVPEMVGRVRRDGPGMAAASRGIYETHYSAALFRETLTTLV